MRLLRSGLSERRCAAASDGLMRNRYARKLLDRLLILGD